MELILFSLLAAAVILEVTKWKLIRAALLIATIAVAVRIIVVYQKDVRVAHMQEVASVELIAELGTNSAHRVTHAAHDYLRDKNAASYEAPFSFGFDRYLREQKRKEDFQQAESTVPVKAAPSASSPVR